MRVEHDERRHRFVIALPEGEGELVYRPVRQGLMDLLHTEVPEEAQGRGAGDALVGAAFAHARASGRRVVPSCPFVRHWLEDHPGERDLVTDM